MLTNNGKKLIAYVLMNNGADGSSWPFPKSGFSLIKIDGQNTSISDQIYQTSSFMSALNHMAINATTNSTTYIRCGTGTTAATKNDYKLESEATGLSCDSVVTAVSSNYTKTYTATFSNTTNTDIAVTEIGFFIYINTQAESYSYGFLLDRIVLSAPITIPAGESKAITYELDF